MKTIIALSILFWAIAYPTYSEPPQNSVETKIAVEDLKNENRGLSTYEALLWKKSIENEIKNLKESTDKGFDNVNQKIDKGFDNVNQKFDDIQKNFDRQNNIIIACIGIPLAILAIGATVCGILTHKRSRKENTLEKQIQTLTEEIETLKQ